MSRIGLKVGFLIAVFFLQSCALIWDGPRKVGNLTKTTLGHVVPSNLLDLDKTALARRQIQTRSYDNVSEDVVLAASAAILQDLGFAITESESRLGIVVGKKERSAANLADATTTTAITVLTLGMFNTNWDQKQEVKASIVTQSYPSQYSQPQYSNFNNRGQAKIVIRAAFQRTVWDSANDISKVETVDDPKVYQAFFDKLSKAIYLEGNM